MSPKGQISIHALLAESDEQFRRAERELVKFLSTLSLRRATCCSLRLIFSPMNFYPRSPCGERLWAVLVIVAPPAFLSTLSLRRATSRHNLCPRKSKISIHALLAESDARRNAHMSRTPISIHALLAESDQDATPICQGLQFLSTLSLRRATAIGRRGTA